MLTHIRMKNFKSWRDSGEVKLAPLTGFFGTNSSGKSSLLQMLLLLKQTIGREEVLFFGDEQSLVNLGSFRDVIHGHDTSALLELECGCKPQEPLSIKVYGEKLERTWADHPVSFHHFTFNTFIRGETGYPSVENLHYRLDSADVPDVRWKNNLLSYQNLFWNQETKKDVDIQNCYGAPLPVQPMFYCRSSLRLSVNFLICITWVHLGLRPSGVIVGKVIGRRISGNREMRLLTRCSLHA